MNHWKVKVKMKMLMNKLMDWSEEYGDRFFQMLEDITIVAVVIILFVIFFYNVAINI